MFDALEALFYAACRAAIFSRANKVIFKQLNMLANTALRIAT